MKKRQLINFMLKKYNCSEIKIVDNLDPTFAGSLCNEGLKIVFDIEKDIINDKRILVIADIITVDNIHLYYEFMSDEDKIKVSHTLLNLLFKERASEINKVLNTLYSSELSDLKVIDTTYYKTNNSTKPDICDNGKCLDWGVNFGTLEVSYFGIKDTLMPINEYIEEIKQSEQYQLYIKNHNLPALIENKQLNKIRRLMFEPYLLHENILVCSFFGSWCLIVLNDDFEITKKYWGEKGKILECFSNFLKNENLDLSILGVGEIKNKTLKPFVMDISCRNSWYDWDKRQ